MKGSAKYRIMQNELDKKGHITSIVRQGKKSFAFIVNGAIIKVFKKRDSANKRISKLHEEFTNRNG